MVTFLESVGETRSGPVSYAEAGVGPPRLALHSLLTDRRAFDPVVEGLGGRVIAMDLPGFGATTPAPPSIDSYADRVADFVETLGVDHEELTLIGNGLGAFVALGVAIRHQELIGRLVLVGCGRSFSEEAKRAFTGMAEKVRLGGMEAVIPIALLRIFTEPYLAHHPEAAAERAAVLRQTDTDAFVTACQALTAMDYESGASAIVAPTMIVVGEEDQATPPQMAEELHATIPDSKLAIIPGLAHAPQLQDPPRFLEVIMPFLETR